MVDPRAIAAAMGGEVHGNSVHFPTPGHGQSDRGTVATVDPDAPDGLLVHSFNGGDPVAIKDELRRKGIIGPRVQEAGSDWSLAGFYDFIDESGVLLYRTKRLEHRSKPKKFTVERPDGNGGWINKIGNARRILYRLPQLLEANPLAPVYLVEGERKADKLADLGFVATAIAFGAKSWKSHYADTLAKRTVIILPDNDQTGAEFAAQAQKDIAAAGGTAAIVTLPGLPPKGDIMDWSGTADELRELSEQALSAKQPSAITVCATPFGWPSPETIPVRRWLLGRWAQRGEITAIISPGGVGKSTFVISVALSLASGRNLIGRQPHEGAVGVWLWNLEDDRIELDRQLSASAKHYGLMASDCEDRLFVNSGLDQPLCVAVDGGEGGRLIEPLYDALKAEIEARRISALIIDPFVSSHSVPENDNGKVDAVVKRWKKLAADTGVAVILVHHSRKPNGQETTVENSRGASALMDASRIGLALNAMSEAEANRFGISDPSERRGIVRLDSGKLSRGAPEGAYWFKLQSVDLCNGVEGAPSDFVGVAAQWTPPDFFSDITTQQLHQAQQVIARGDYGASIMANDWAGIAIAPVLGLDPHDCADKAKLKSIIATWTENGCFVVERRRTNKGRDKPFLIVGRAVDPSEFPTTNSGAGESGESGGRHYQ